MKGIFITGTDTGVGKTYIGVQLAKALTERGIRVIPRKPVESGCIRQGNGLIPQDALALKNAANYSGALNEVCPYPFEAAVSPARAAELVHQKLHIEDFKNACLNGIDEKDFLLVEGAGGFYSPLCSDGLNADLVQTLNLPVLLVAEDRVGCINHVLLTFEAFLKRKINIQGIVLNHKTLTPTGMNNAQELALYVNCPIFQTTPSGYVDISTLLDYIIIDSANS